MAREEARFRGALIASLLAHAAVIGGIALARRPDPPPATGRLLKVDLALLPSPAPKLDRAVRRSVRSVPVPKAPRPAPIFRPIRPTVSQPPHAPRPASPLPRVLRAVPIASVSATPSVAPSRAPVLALPAPRPVAVSAALPAPEAARPHPAPTLAPRAPVASAPRPSPRRQTHLAPLGVCPPLPRRILLAVRPGNSGGRLSVGATSAAGTIDAGPSGATPGGSVPNPAAGGSGSGAGDVPRGRGSAEPPPDPVKSSDPGPQAAAPPRHDDLAADRPPPPPARVTLRICKRSGLPAGEYCQETDERSFLKSDAPTGRCKACERPAPEHMNRVADRAEPEVVREVQPDYPEELREQGVQGTVTVRYTVDENGRVTGVSVDHSSGSDALDDAAVRAIRRFRYRPAQQDGKPRPFQKTKRFVFRLSE